MPIARPLDFALFSSPSYSRSLENRHFDVMPLTRPFVMLCMKGPAYWRHQVNTHLQKSSPARLRQDMAGHAGPHLSNLVTCWTESASHLEVNPLPEWLVLFGVIHDGDYVRIIAHIPFRGRHALPRYLSCLVEELPFGAPLFPQGSATCRKIADRLRIVLAFLTLRRHADDLRRLLFGSEACQNEASCSVGSSSLKHSQCSAHHKTLSSTSVLLSDGLEDGSSDYSTCESVSPRATELNDEGTCCSRNKLRSFSRAPSTKTVNRSSKGNLSFCTSSTSCCSSLSSLSGNTSPSSYEYSERRSWNGSRRPGFMEPSTSSLYQGNFCTSEAELPDPLYCLRALDNGKRAEIVAWIENTYLAQPPEDDIYYIGLER
ncbi:hypothetical protein EDC04DRAFT_2140216 [Pisolithus marmoratus]|nr:hypothetical protein EDC04DRAFT_2140216 [Pisolithus marmoratus]